MNFSIFIIKHIKGINFRDKPKKQIGLLIDCITQSSLFL